jgi:hypothetical protein
MSATLGTSNQPALGIASIVRNIILAAPFTWRFNRGSATFLTVSGTQDYAQTISTFGFLEAATLQLAATITNVAGDGTTATITAANSLSSGQAFTISGLTHTGFNVSGTILNATSTQFTFASAVSQASIADSGTAVAGPIIQIKDIYNTEVLAPASEQARPNAICVLQDNGANSYTFRFMSVPDKTYQVQLVFQKGPVQFAATSDGWAPIPDAFSDIFNNLFLGYYLDSCQDPIGGQYIARGGAALLAKAEGLSEMDKAIFMQAFLNLDAAQIIAQLSAQQGRQAMGAK